MAGDPILRRSFFGGSAQALRLWGSWRRIPMSEVTEKELEHIRIVLARYLIDRDRRFELACNAIAGLASRGMGVEDIASTAVQIADATLKKLGDKP
jgi:hypothetical protein